MEHYKSTLAEVPYIPAPFPCTLKLNQSHDAAGVSCPYTGLGKFS